ncbi:MAG: DNA repair protein RecO [Candidatus Delongbacteria bacterium]|nr:DNA repair protein RecO [Candidatus Delongbacteria bacterium]
MSMRRCRALVLRGIPFGDTSLVERFFTREEGALTLLVKGARRSGSPLLSVLQTGQLVEVLYYHRVGRDLQLFKEASVLEDFRGVRDDYSRLVSYSAICEALDHSQLPGHADEGLFDASVRCLADVAGNCPHPVNALYWFLLYLLGRSGYYIDLSRCAGCGREVEGFARLPGTSLERLGGGLRCPECTGPGPERPLSPRLVRVLHFLASSRREDVTTREITRETRAALGSLLDELLQQHLEHWRGLGSLEACAGL